MTQGRRAGDADRPVSDEDFGGLGPDVGDYPYAGLSFATSETGGYEIWWFLLVIAFVLWLTPESRAAL